MPSPRSSPAMHPKSPLSPRYETARLDTVQPPSPRAVHHRTNRNSRSANKQSIMLPTLPRFHPANFPSADSIDQSTPGAGASSLQVSISDHSHQRKYSGAQKQLFMYQREKTAAVTRSSREDNPASPRLVPLSSPGPVTPLELEQSEGYLGAGKTKDRSKPPADPGSSGKS
ncbi:hypothetical protein WHR41_09439 [Cladosporium halotolerans]|uniref:Uncharacterized protein n=1 Tax=Cladosporium halotolerans TaxID=1052096 RepID=A0AB34KG00_9PEZI